MAKKIGVAASGASRSEVTRVIARSPITPVAAAATKLAVGEKHMGSVGRLVLDTGGLSVRRPGWSSSRPSEAAACAL
jgi:hypothetical protein